MGHGKALRIRVIKAVVEDGLSRNEAARIFRVGIASAIHWVKAFEETRRRTALPTSGDRRELRSKENDPSDLHSTARRSSRPHLRAFWSTRLATWIDAQRARLPAYRVEARSTETRPLSKCASKPSRSMEMPNLWPEIIETLGRNHG